MFDEIIREVDINGDGVITFDEFKIMMKKFLDDEIKSRSSNYTQGGRALVVKHSMATGGGDGKE